MTDLYLAELTVYDPSVPGVITLRYSSGQGLTTLPSETPANTIYDARLKQPATMTRNLFGAGRTSGASQIGYGDLILRNGDGALDALLTYGLSGRALVIRRGAVGAAYPGGFPIQLACTMEQPEATGDDIVIKVRDGQLDLQRPYQPIKYAGNNSLPAGLEGVAGDLKGKPKPICLGTVLNVPPPCVNTSKLIYQVNNNPISSLGAVYDAGAQLTIGRPWKAKTIAFGANAINAAAFGNGLWLVAGEAGKLFTSPDGDTWTSRTSGFGADTINGLCYGNGVYVAVGNAGKLFTSANGTTGWTAQTSSFGADAIICVTYSVRLGLYIAGSNTGKLATSPDAATWTQRTPTQFGGAEIIYQIIEAREILVAVGEGPRVVTSPDGVTWTQRFLGVPGSNDLRSVAFLPFAGDDGMFVACGVPSGVQAQTFLTSVDAFTWTRLTSPFGVNGGKVIIANAVRAVVVQSSLFGSTVDAFSWILRTDGNLGNALALASDGTDFLAAGTLSGNGAVVKTTQATYASSTELLDDALAPMAGEAIAYLTGGYFRLGAPPFGLITADVTVGSSAASRTTGQLFATIMTLAGKSSGSAAGNYSGADVTALDTANSSVIGDYQDQEDTFADALDRVAASGGAWWGVDKDGVYRIQQFTAPSGSPVATITANDLHSPLARVVPQNDESHGLPTWRTIVRYQKNYAVQDSGLAGVVTDARRGFLVKEWRESIVEDTAVKTAHLLAVETIVETLLSVAADAATEATRLQTLRGVLRHVYDCVVPIKNEVQDFSTVDLGQVVTLQHPRYGLSAGVLCKVIGVMPNARQNRVTLRVWR